MSVVLHSEVSVCCILPFIMWHTSGLNCRLPSVVPVYVYSSHSVVKYAEMLLGIVLLE